MVAVSSLLIELVLEEQSGNIKHCTRVEMCMISRCQEWMRKQVTRYSVWEVS